MADPGTPDTALESRLDTWGASERARLVEPAPRFLRAVRLARPRRLLPRALQAGLIAAGIGLVAVVLHFSGSEPRSVPDRSNSPDFAASDALPRFLSAGIGRDTEAGDVFEMLDAMPDTTRDEPRPVRAHDVYCAGCLDELLGI